MADISAEIAAFKNAAYGEDVRDSMVSLANKLNNSVTNGLGLVTNWRHLGGEVIMGAPDLFLRLNTQENTITIPRDTVIHNPTGGAPKILSEEIVIDLIPITTTGAQNVYYDFDSDSFTSYRYDTKNSAIPINSVWLCSIRIVKNAYYQISSIMPWTADDLAYGLKPKPTYQSNGMHYINQLESLITEKDIDYSKLGTYIVNPTSADGTVKVTYDSAQKNTNLGLLTSKRISISHDETPMIILYSKYWFRIAFVNNDDMVVYVTSYAGNDSFYNNKIWFKLISVPATATGFYCSFRTGEKIHTFGVYKHDLTWSGNAYFYIDRLSLLPNQSRRSIAKTCFNNLAIPIVGSDTQKYINFDTITSILTIPRDTVMPTMFGGLYDYDVSDKRYIRLTPLDKQTEIDLSIYDSSALVIFYDLNHSEYIVQRYDNVISNTDLIWICSIRRSSWTSTASITSILPWSIDDNPYGIQLNNTEYEGIALKSVNHRGWYECPENTAIAYKESAKHGFAYVETDISPTLDGVLCCLHDGTINRTARNVDGSEIETPDLQLSSITYNDALQYDFGIYKGIQYAGIKILTFYDFIKICKLKSLHPYIELKNTTTYTDSMFSDMLNTVKRFGMEKHVTYISFSYTLLSRIKTLNPTARLGFLGDVGENALTSCLSLKTETNEVFLDASYKSDDDYTDFIEAGIPIEVWTINSPNVLNMIDGYVSGVTTDSLLVRNLNVNIE